MKLSKLAIKTQYLIVFLLGILIIVFYSKNVKNIYTVWQIGDEAGYLMNAAFFTNHDWSSIYDVIPYYGYGYSIILIPLFIFFDTGVKIIRGAIFINILCVAATYFLQIAVMKIITQDNRLYILALISFVVCFYPYMVSETFQIIAESFLVMLFWISIFLLCKALEKQNACIYMLYGICIAYMFFVHARAVLVIVAAFFTIFICMIHKYSKVKHVVLFLSAFVIFFLVGYFIKKYIISVVYIGVSVGELKDRNLITRGYIFDRIKWLFDLENIHLYIYGFFAKVFYLFASTAVMAIVGIVALYRKLRNKKISNIQSVSIIFILLSFFLTFLACCVSGTGASENFTYFFYGRYFEYTILPIVFIGIYVCLSYRINVKEISIILVLCIVSGIISSNIVALLDSSEVHIDVYRIAGFSYGAEINTNFESLIFCLTISTVLIVILIFLSHQLSKFKIIILLLTMSFFINNSIVCIKTINKINQRAVLDLEIAEYINDNYVNEHDHVYFINDTHKYYGFYSRMQVMMPDVPMIVISLDQIDQVEVDSFVITYKGTSSDISLSDTKDLLLEGSVFNLYRKD